MDLVKIYKEICKEKNYSPRFFIEEALKYVEEKLGKKFILLLKLPTGYGKSSIIQVFARSAIEGNPYFSRVIHVLPMRSIIKDLYDRLSEDEKIKENLAFQHMLSPGSPYFAKKCVITTLDTFVLNFFKAPAYEIRKIFQFNTSHFEFSRGLIYTSLVIFDEFHLFSDLGKLEEESKSLTSVITSIECLASAGVPVIILTATIPKVLEEILEKSAKRIDVEFKVIEFNEKDKEYKEILSKKEKIIKLKFDKNIEDLIKEALKNNKSILVVVNTVEKALQIYSKFKNSLLLHGRLPEVLRKELFEKFKNKKEKLVISTQVIESGVDISFDIMITENCPADRLVQRAGRVARFEEENKGEIWIVSHEKAAPYDEEILNKTKEVLENNKNLTYEYSQEIINKVYSNVKYKFDRRLQRSLEYLEYSPFFSHENAKKIIEHFNGITNNFGIVSCFREDFLDKNYAIPLNQDKAFKYLEKERKLVTFNPKTNSYEVKEISENEVIRFNRGLSLRLLEKGYEGIIISKKDYEEMIGFSLEKIKEIEKPKIEKEEFEIKEIKEFMPYKPCAGLKQSLENHINGTLKYATKIVERDASVISNRFLSTGLKIEPKKVVELIKIISVLHDIGKAAEIYQKPFLENCECDRKFNFILHELSSAILVEKIKKPNLSSEENMLVKLTILLHLNRSLEGIEFELEKRRREIDWNFDNYKDKIIKIMSNYGINLEIENINFKKASNFINKIRNELQEKGKEYLRLYCLLFYPLCAGDNLDAFENREKRTDISPSRIIFMKELKEVVG